MDADKAGVRLRIATLRDVDAIVPIVNGAYRGDAGAHGWTSEHELVEGPRIDAPRLDALLANKGSFVLVAERDGRIVGCVHLQQGAERVCELGLLSVRVAEQGSGAGRDILRQAEAYAREAMGARVVAMHVVSVRAELLAWYERRGYVRTGRLVAFEPSGGQRSLRGPLQFERLEKRVA